MQQYDTRTCFFSSVEPLPDYRLRINTLPGEEIIFDFSSRLSVIRFADLKNVPLFHSVRTDGRAIVFELPGYMPIIISADEFLELLARIPQKPRF